MALNVTLDSLIRAMEDSAPDLLGQLANASATASELGELGDSLLGVFVDRCRRDGRSWSEIGGSLGVTKQAVQKRFVTPGALHASLMLERFTPRARHVLEHATNEAHALGHAHRGTEHLLLGLFDEPDGVAALVLGERGITRETVLTAVLLPVPRGDAAPVGEPPLTPRAVRVLELTLSAALELGHNYLGTEHLLLALLRERGGVAAQVLHELGVDDDGVKRRVVELLSGYPSA